MQVVKQLEQGAFSGKPVVLAIGFFDGIHRGHQAVIQEAQKQARLLEGEAWVLTFDPHPLVIIAPERAPRLLTSARHKCLLMKRYGMDGCIVLPFDEDMRWMRPDAFLQYLSDHIPGLKHVAVGENWAFGRGQRGNAANLRDLASGLHIKTSVIRPVLDEGEPVSSTRVRQAVTGGDLRLAADMLGRAYSIYGHVVHGREVGRTLGFPTANVNPCNEVHPPNGIYAARAAVADTMFDAAAYIGYRPTFAADDEWVVEVFLPGEHLDLYDHEIEISFIEKIRDDRAFESIEQLKEQITKDVAAVKQLLG